MRVYLKASYYVAITYCSNLRVGSSGEDPVVELRQFPDKVLITPEHMGHKLVLNMTHGRKDPKEEMEDFGFCASSVEGHVAPTGDAILFLEEGVKVITYKDDGTWDERLIPFVEDMLFYEGNYYGDYSADNDRRVA
jgi:hypothetical protein